MKGEFTTPIPSKLTDEQTPWLSSAAPLKQRSQFIRNAVFTKIDPQKKGEKPTATA